MIQLFRYMHSAPIKNQITKQAAVYRGDGAGDSTPKGRVEEPAGTMIVLRHRIRPHFTIPPMDCGMYNKRKSSPLMPTPSLVCLPFAVLPASFAAGLLACGPQTLKLPPHRAERLPER
jgi:hypothetical protein